MKEDKDDSGDATDEKTQEVTSQDNPMDAYGIQKETEP
jgi:hypothetical protein